ncbi:MAG: CoA-binding protein [Thermoplasmatales archaeon]|nr:CoA-binding protein [Thermoplasmatales archaeon]
MEKFFKPKSVVVIGASSKKGKIGYEIFNNIIKSKVEAYPINPNRKKILGRKCYKSLEEINKKIDLAVIAVEAKKCVEEVEKCGIKGIKNIVIISGGFKEIGEAEIERKIVQLARKYKMRVIGPNCIGVFNAENGFNTFFQRNMELPKKGNVAILTQSGTFGIALLEKCAVEGIGVTKFVSYGNKADVSEVDLVKYLKKDKKTDIIAIYAEEIGRDFFEVENEKITVILKSGRSKLGQKVASLHTGAMATNHKIFEGACKQRNIIFVDDFEEFFGVLKILAMRGLPPDQKVAIITNGAGPSVMACDFAGEARHIEIAETIDLTGSATAKDFLEAIERSKEDIIILTFVFQDSPLAESLKELYSGLKKMNRYFLAICMGGKFVEEQKKKLLRLKIPVFEEPRVAIGAIDKIVGYKLRK